MRSLASPKHAKITIEKRRLTSLAEWVSHYPAKTLDGKVRRLRLDLLPVLAEWLTGNDGPGPRFNALENERFAFGGAHQMGSFGAYVAATARQHRFGAEWSAIESQIWERLDGPKSTVLFYLLVRGKGLFTDAPIDARESLQSLVAACAEQKLLPEPTLDQLRSLLDRALPRTRTEFLALKSYMYQCIQPVRIRQPEMKHEALEALIKAKPDYMSAVPGFSPPPPRTDQTTLPEEERWRGAVAKGSALSRLVDHSAFQEFQFLHLRTAADSCVADTPVSRRLPTRSPIKSEHDVI